MFKTTMWHLGDEWNVGIDPDDAKIQGLGHSHRTSVIGSPDARCQSVRNSVSELHRFSLIAKCLNGDNWSEDLALCQFIVLMHACNNRWREEISSAINCGSAGDNLCMLWGALYESLDARQLVGIVKRTVENIFCRSAGLNLIGCLIGKKCNKLLVDLSLN